MSPALRIDSLGFACGDKIVWNDQGAPQARRAKGEGLYEPDMAGPNAGFGVNALTHTYMRDM